MYVYNNVFYHHKGSAVDQGKLEQWWGESGFKARQIFGNPVSEVPNVASSQSWGGWIFFLPYISIEFDLFSLVIFQDFKWDRYVVL